MGIQRGGIPAAAFTSPMRPQRNKFRWFLEIYFRLRGNRINSKHCADSHGRARQVTAITSVLYFITEIEIHTWDSLIINFEIHKFSCKRMEYDKHLMIPYCIHTLIWIINFCYRVKNCVKSVSFNPSSLSWPALQRNRPSKIWNTLIGRNVNFCVSIRPNLTL